MDEKKLLKIVKKKANLLMIDVEILASEASDKHGSSYRTLNWYTYDTIGVKVSKHGKRHYTSWSVNGRRVQREAVLHKLTRFLIQSPQSLET